MRNKKWVRENSNIMNPNITMITLNINTNFYDKKDSFKTGLKMHPVLIYIMNFSHT